MKYETVELTGASLVDRTLLAVRFSDGTEALFPVDELLAYKPKRYLLEDSLDAAELIKAESAISVGSNRREMPHLRRFI